MKRILSISLLCALVLMFSSCKKETRYVYVSDEMKEWFNFKEGTYWIMKNTLDNSLDSFVISSPAGHIFRSYGQSNVQYESYYISVSRFSINSSSAQARGGTFRLWSKENENGSDITFAGETKDIIYPFITIPFKPQWDDKRYQEVNITIEILPNFAVNGHVFDEVYHLKYTFSGMQNSEHIYFKKELGMLKLILDHDEVRRSYEIERWNIIK